MTRDEAYRNAVAWMLIASGLTAVIRLLVKRAADDPGIDEDLSQLLADVLADGKNTVLSEPVSAEDEAYAVGKAIDQLDYVFAKFLRDLRHYRETGAWPEDYPE